MLSQSIIQKILAKFGREKIYSGDCAYLAAEIRIGDPPLVVCSVGSERVRRSAMEILAKWLGYENYKQLLKRQWNNLNGNHNMNYCRENSHPNGKITGTLK